MAGLFQDRRSGQDLPALFFTILPALFFSSAVPAEGQELEMATVRLVTFEQLVLNRYNYDGERVALKGYCTQADSVSWAHEFETYASADRSVRIESEGPVTGCSGEIWAVGWFTAEQQYLGTIELLQPLSPSIIGEAASQPPAVDGGPPFVTRPAAGGGAAEAVVPQNPSCPDPLVLDEEALARGNAPTLRFAEPERYFPTIPFHTAFDGLDLDGDGVLGFADPDEVAPPGGQTRTPGASWTRLRDAYDTALEDLQNRTVPGTLLYPPVPAVFYRVRLLDEGDVRQLWRFLRTDEQAWRRHQMDDFWDRWSGGCRAMASVEYYFYYLDDWGLEGHEEDIEFEFVFVTLHPRDDATDLRVSVGAGHGSRAPNNTLVIVEENANRTNHVLVELGGHASAPDAIPRPEFAKFIDVNWHTTDLWGTRDILALAGSGFIGQYTPEMTLPRERGVAMQPRTGSRAIGYSLLPVSRFQRLDSLVASGANDDAVLAQLRGIAADVPGTHVPTRLSPEVRLSLELWAQPLCCGRKGRNLAPGKRRIWEHEHYRKAPTAILMTHLYRPTGTAIQTWRDRVELWTWSVAWVPEDLGGLSAGIVIPVVFQEQIPVRIRGFLSAELGWVRAFDDSGDKDGWTARLTYDWSYSRFIGWYAAAQYTSDKWDHRDQRFDDSFALSGGASLLLMTADDRDWWKPVRAFRLRAGPRFRPSDFDNLLDDVGIELQLVLR